MQTEINVSTRTTIKDALKKLDLTARRVLLVTDEENHLLGTLSDGDIRRYLLKAESLANTIETIYNQNPRYIIESAFTLTEAQRMIHQYLLDVLPVVDDEKRVVRFLTWGEVFEVTEKTEKIPTPLLIPIIIIAGGKGTRLEPFTKIFPKPLIPVGEMTMLEHIIHQFKRNGAHDFRIILNYKGEMIQSYMDSVVKDYKINYLWEKTFQGTAGSLKLLEGLANDTFILSNCDVIVKADYADVIRFHEENKAALTVLSSIQHYKIPYGVIRYKPGGEVTEISEKPEYTFPINTGVYVLDKMCLDFIPQDAFYNMPDLIVDLIKQGHKVLTYPVNESDYLDIGQWDEYKKTTDRLNLIL